MRARARANDEMPSATKREKMRSRRRGSWRLNAGSGFGRARGNCSKKPTMDPERNRLRGGKEDKQGSSSYFSDAQNTQNQDVWAVCQFEHWVAAGELDSHGQPTWIFCPFHIRSSIKPAWQVGSQGWQNLEIQLGDPGGSKRGGGLRVHSAR